MQWENKGIALSVLPVAWVQFPAMAEYFKGFFPGWSHFATPSWVNLPSITPHLRKGEMIRLSLLANSWFQSSCVLLLVAELCSLHHQVNINILRELVCGGGIVLLLQDHCAPADCHSLACDRRVQHCQFTGLGEVIIAITKCTNTTIYRLDCGINCNRGQDSSGVKKLRFAIVGLGV